jgi:predicted  nucleic acid-binding Zn-ribbon protein
MKFKILAFAGLMLSNGFAFAQTIGGTYNAPFGDRLRDPDTTGDGSTAILYTHNEYTVQKAGTGSITLTYYDEEDLPTSLWEDSAGTWTSEYRLFINDVEIARIETKHAKKSLTTGVWWLGSTQSVTLPITVVPGRMKVEIKSLDLSRAPSGSDKTAMKANLHSVAGKVAYALTLPSDLTGEFERLQNQITALKNENTVINNRIDQNAAEITELKNQVAANTTSIADNTEEINKLKARVTTIESEISSLQIQVTNNFNELKGLIADQQTILDRYTTEINTLTGDVSNLRTELTTLTNTVNNNFLTLTTDLSELTTRVNNNYEEFTTIIGSLRDKLEDHDIRFSNIEKRLAAQDKAMTDMEARTNGHAKNLNDRLVRMIERIDRRNLRIAGQVNDLRDDLSDLQDEVEQNDAEQRKLTWIVGGSAAALGVAGIVSEGVYDAYKTDWEYKNFGTPVTTKNDPEANNATGSGWWNPGGKPQANSSQSYGASGWATGNN